MTIKTNYSIHNFMPAVMGLCGAELLVYALIYSFSKTGVYNGSRAYISGATGLGIRSVDRALASLVEKGYIIRSADGKTPTYVADMSYAEKCERELIKNACDYCQNGTRQNGRRLLPKRQPRPAKTADNNKEIIKDIISLSSSSSSAHTREKKSVRYDVGSYGADGLISLTREQHEYLLTLVDSETLADYIRKLELYLLSAPENPIRNHFKTLCKFINEDFSLPKD